MSILSSFGRYMRARGRLLYTESLGWTSTREAKRSRRKNKGSARSQYLELMEPRVMMTTVLGGETFRYFGADGLPVLAHLNGNVVAELTSAVQAGGFKTLPGTASGGYLVLGDIVGQITSGPRSGTIIGNGSIPVSLGGTSSASTRPLALNYTSNQIHFESLASNTQGLTYTFNAFDTDSTGTVVKTNSTPQQAIWTFQILQLNTATGASTVVVTNTSDAGGIIPLDATGAHIPAAAFNPFDGKFYFELNYSVTDATSGITTYTDDIYSWPGAGAPSLFSAINTVPGPGGVPDYAVKGMAFGHNATTTAGGTLYVFMDASSSNTDTVNFVPTLLQYNVSSTGAFTVNTARSTLTVSEGFGSARVPLKNVVGLATLPNTFGDGVSNGSIFAMVSTGTNGGLSHVTRIDLTPTGANTLESMNWGNTIDLAERPPTQTTLTLNPTGIVDGSAPAGFTFNPAVVDPFSGQLGAWMSMDINIHNVNPRLSTNDDLLFVNHDLRINQGDVFNVYSNFADISSSIVFEGSGTYAGNIPGLGSSVGGPTGTTTAPPGATGTVYIGFRGEIPSAVTPNDTTSFIANVPYMTAQLIGSLGIIPSRIIDLSDPTDPNFILQSSQTLPAGLIVPKSLQEPLNPNGNLLSNTLGSGARNVSGLAISADGTIAIVNSNITTQSSRDQLGFVNPNTGAITGGLVNVTLNGNPGFILRNVEALAYGDFNLSGTSSLYAVYDLGSGPVLGTIASSGVFTPIGSMNLGTHGHVNAIAFTPGGTQADPTHESLYVAADPNNLDNNSTQSLYQVNLNTGAVLNAPAFNANGDVISSGGIGRIVDSGTRGVTVAAAFFDTNGRLLIDDQATGRLLDVNLTNAQAGVNYTSTVGLINPTVTGIALDPSTLRYLVVDNLTGLAGLGGGTTSSIIMALRDLTSNGDQNVSLGKFLVDGTFTGRVVVFGSMDMFYGGEILAGDATGGGFWLNRPSVPGGSATNDTALLNNSFANSFYIGGDIRNIVSLTNFGLIGGSLTTGLQVNVGGKLGATTVLGSFAGMAHAANNDNVTGLIDTSHVSLSDIFDAFGFTYRGSATSTSGFLSLTNGTTSTFGSVFSNQQQAIDSFQANFSFQAFQTINGIDGGFAFVLQNQGLPALGGGGSGLGYSGILHSAALEFIFNSSGSGGTIGLRTNGAVGGGTFVSIPNIHSGDTFNVNVTYSGSTMLVSLSDLTNPTISTYSTQFTINLPSVLGAHGAYVGFTGSSGTLGSFTRVTGFNFDGLGNSGQAPLAQGEIQTYGINPDYTFAKGFLVSRGAIAPFDNQSFATAQYLGSVRNSIAGQPANVIHVVGTLDSLKPTTANPINNTVDYYAFSMLAGETVTVQVKPLASGLSGSLTSTPDLANYAIFDPDGNMVMSDYNLADFNHAGGVDFSSLVNTNRAIQFTADRPGTYRIAINNNGSTAFVPGGNFLNISYELTITGGGVGNLGLGAINAGGNILLEGASQSVQVDSGDLGVLHAGGSITAAISSSGLIGRISTSLGAFFSGVSSQNIFVPQGDFHAMDAANIGFLSVANGFGSLVGLPDISVNGEVGLLSANATGGMMAAWFGHAAGGNIQVISSAGDIEGVYRTNKAIGVIRAAQVSNLYTTQYGLDTEFNVDVDRINRDGAIDLIAVTGDWGAIDTLGFRASGADLVTGPGGNIRFMQIGGVVSQDIAFTDSAVTGANGEVIHAPGPVGFVDDSGASMTITPANFSVLSGTNGTVTTTGVITTRSYGVRGGAGSVLIDISTNTSVSIDLKAGPLAEIGTITVNSPGATVVTVNGIPTSSTGGSTANSVTITSSGGGELDLYSVIGTQELNAVWNHSGDIINANASDIGFIRASGNIGTVTNTTGAALIPFTLPLGTLFPFASQYSGIFTRARPQGFFYGNIGEVTAGKAVGNVSAGGAIGTVTANSDNVDDPNAFEGIVGLIVANGTAAATDTSVGLGSTRVSLAQVNIGEGIAAQGTGTFPRTGIYSYGRLGVVSGSNADIRGNVVSATSIGTITLTNGSIVNSQIDVLQIPNIDPISSSFALAGIFDTASQTFPTYNINIDTPLYVIDTINLQGNGGIIGSVIGATNIRNIIVGPAGFGMLSTRINGVGDGTIANISIGGYGIRRSFISAARVLNIAATGSGAEAPLSNFSLNVHTSDHAVINQFDGLTPSVVSDIETAIFGDGIIYTPDSFGLTTGVIGLTTVQGEDRLGTASAFDVKDSSFSFPQGTNAVTIRHDAFDSQFLSGGFNSFTLTHNAVDLEVTSAGPIGSVFIGGSFGSGGRGFVTQLAQVAAKGGNGVITTFVAKGPFAGLLLAEGKLGTATFGVAGVGPLPSTGDFTGTITVGGKLVTAQVLDSLKIFGSFSGGVLDVTGNTGTIDIAHDVSASAGAIELRGNVAKLIVGSDPAVNGSTITSPIFVSGNLNGAVITGKLLSSLVVLGNASNIAFNTDPATVGTDLIPVSGALSVGGTLSGLTVLGGVSGNIVAGSMNNIIIGKLAGELWGGRGIAAVTINGDLMPGGSINSALGDITKLTVNGNINGSVTVPNGALSSLTLTGSVGTAGSLTAVRMGGLTIPGAVSGTISATTSITSLKVGSVTNTAYISAPNLGALTTIGDLNGVLNIGPISTALKIIVGGNFGGDASVGSPFTMTVAGNIVSGSTLSSSSNLTSLAVKGSIAGDILIDGVITTLTAASVNNAVITAGMGLTTFTVTGTISNTLIDVGLARGNDGIFGTGDVGEQARMADAGAISAASLINTIITVGGNITTLKLLGNMSSSTVSAGFVIEGDKINAVGSDPSPLGSNAELNAARDATLLHGSIKSATVGTGTASTLINSSITAGVSPGADGAFGTVDDNVFSSVTGGVSAITAFKGNLDGTSHLLANASSGSATLVGYTVGTASSSILSADPITGLPNQTAFVGTTATISTAQGIITITVTGLGATVKAYDSGATSDRLDTLLISSTTSAPVTVLVHTSSANSFGLGRVITTDGTNLANFTFDGDILGDDNGGPSLWIDSDMVAFTARNLPNSPTWSGQIGGNVTKLTLNQLGPGHFRIGGRVLTLTIGASAGDPFLQQLGSPGFSVQQLAFDQSTGNLFATDGTHVVQVDPITGATSSGVSVHSLLDGSLLNVSGISFDGFGQLFGIATVNNLDPLNLVGSITTTGDTLRGMAVNSSGDIYAIDTIAGIDNLVKLDPVTGKETVLGVIKDAANDTYSQNILALAFDTNDNLLALTNDRDGSGQVNTTSSGVALGRITPNLQTGIIRFSNPTSTLFAPVIIAGNPTEDYKGLAVDPNTGAIYAVRRVGATDELDTLVVTGSSNAVTVTQTGHGTIKINSGATDTNLAGIGVDENHNVIGLNVTGTTSQLISINTGTAGTSVLFEAPNLIPHAFAAFALGRSGTNFRSYAYTTNATTGGLLYTNVGLTPTIGKIDSLGGFTNLLPAVQDASNTALSGNILGIADDGSGHIFAITDHGVLLEYNNTDGSLVGGTPVGVVKNASGVTLRITRISFDGSGRLIGLNGIGNNLVQINTFPSLVNGVSVVEASNITDIGTADGADLTALAFFSGTGQTFTGKFLSYSQITGNLVTLLGTDPNSLGGLIANSFGAVILPGSFSSRLAATGNGLLNSIDSIKITGAGTFTGKVESRGGIGTVAGTGSTFAGTIVSHGDITGITMGGTVTSTGIFAADGLIKALTFTGPFNGDILANRATALTINGSLGSAAVLSVVYDVGALTITGADAGTIDLGSVASLKITGALLAGSSLNIAADSAAVTLSGGVALGSLVVASAGLTSLTVGGTLAGVVAVKKSVGTATLQNVVNGLLDVGQDIGALTVNGNVSSSILAAGTWIGADGLYNTSDDVIFGGGITTAKIAGVFSDSLVTAGVLPPESAAADINNIPLNRRVFTYNPNALTVQEIDAAESGGIGQSIIKNISFSKPVISSNIAGGLFSTVVAADGVTKVTATGNLQPSVIRTDPPGAPQVAIKNSAPLITAINSGLVQITFDQPIDTATISNATVVITNFNTSELIKDATFSYFTKVADDGSIQGVLQVFSASNFGGATNLQIALTGGPTAPTITDRTGLRSSLSDFNQDGIPDASGDPFGTTLPTGQTFVIPIS